MKNTVKKLVLAMAIAGSAMSAQAATYAITPGSSFAAGVNGSFTDYLTFSLAQPSSFAYAVANLVSSSTQTFTFGGASFSMTIISNITDLAASLYSGVPNSGSLIDPGVGSLSAGSYFIKVTGTGTGTGGLGSYGVASQVAAVPEPESYAMFLAGLGIIGAIARRRKVA